MVAPADGHLIAARGRRQPDRRPAVAAAGGAGEDAIDRFVAAVVQDARRQGAPGWGLYGRTLDGRTVRFGAGTDADPVAAMVGRWAPPDTTVMGLYLSGRRCGSGAETVVAVAADARRRSAVAEGRGRELEHSSLDVTATGVAAVAALCRVVGVDIGVAVDGRRSALTLLAKACVEVALDGGDLTDVAAADPVVMTAAVLGHLGGMGARAYEVPVDLDELVRRCRSMGAGVGEDGDWIDGEVLDLLDDHLLRRSVAGFAQEALACSDEDANWWGVDALVAQLDEVLFDVDESLALAAQWDFDLAAAVGRCIGTRRRRWGIVL